jgi:hypothetical protein
MTDSFIVENPPLMESQDGKVLAEYLQRQMLNLSQSLSTTHDWQDDRPVDGKPQDGMVRYISEVDVLWPGSPGLYLYQGGGWLRITTA